jgi:hypothetical protein
MANAEGMEVSQPIEQWLLKRPKADVVLHKNGDRLDVRRVNLKSPRSCP